MTHIEFSKKYKIDYSTVYNAGCLPTVRNGREYDEEDMRETLLKKLNNRKAKMESDLRNINGMIQRLSEGK